MWSDDFNIGQRLAITEEIIELIDSLGGSGVLQNKPRGGRRFEDNVMVFYKKT